MSAAIVSEVVEGGDGSAIYFVVPSFTLSLFANQSHELLAQFLYCMLCCVNIARER